MKSKSVSTTEVAIVLPNQLFKTPLFSKDATVYLIEEFLFFKQYRFHQQKIAFHRATMKYYESHLMDLGYDTKYIESGDQLSKLSDLLEHLVESKCSGLQVYKPVDNWIEKSFRKYDGKFEWTWFENPLFINEDQNLETYFKPKKSFHQTDFYKLQRQQLQILMAGDKPEGGQWSFDADNRKKFPKNKQAPYVKFPDSNPFYEEAVAYTQQHFGDHYGQLTKSPLYPLTFKDADAWLTDFLENRFHEFGIYEDAIVRDEHILHHSVLSPLINIGFLSPKEIISKTLQFGATHHIPINSIEGFVRQVLGWREFVRGVYQSVGVKQRNSNFFKHRSPIPKSFYDATTGIPPIDATIKKLLSRGYLHHIERLMLLANFMNLCGIDPNAIYQWFMELFIDAYDWVMVPNVYGMSLYADGGLMSTKPYISGSNYVLKMSDYDKGEWQEIWDALFWNFLDQHRIFFEKQPRLSMLLRNFDKLDPEQRAKRLVKADDFLKQLHQDTDS